MVYYTILFVLITPFISIVCFCLFRTTFGNK